MEDFKPFFKMKTQFDHKFPSEQILFILLYKKKTVQIKKTGEENLFLSLFFHLLYNKNLSSAGDFPFKRSLLY